jgi:hypothetical protein
LNEKREEFGIEELRICVDFDTYKKLVEMLHKFGFSENKKKAGVLSRKRFKGEDAFGLVIGYCIRVAAGETEGELPAGYTENSDFRPLLELHRLKRCCEKLLETKSKNEVVTFLKEHDEPTPDMILFPNKQGIKKTWTKPLLNELIQADFTNLAKSRAHYENIQLRQAPRTSAKLKRPTSASQLKKKPLLTNKKKT